MSTNKTENLNLHVWEPTDAFRRAEFNENFAAIDAAMGAIPHIVFGSYVGTGEYGSANRNSLTFDFTPQYLVFITTSPYTYNLSSAPSAFVLVWGQTTEFFEGNQEQGENFVNYSGNSIQWFARAAATWQRNSKGTTYRYLAIG